MIHVCCSSVKEAKDIFWEIGIFNIIAINVFFCFLLKETSESVGVLGLLASTRSRLPTDFIQLQTKRSTLLSLLFPQLRFS